MRTLYICGRVRDSAVPWEFHGVFTSMDAALDQCKTPDHFVGPVLVDQPLIDEPQMWPGAVFPIDG